MMANVKNDPRNIRRNGSLTRKGRNELEAIDQIRTNQDAGHRYVVDDANSTFKLVDKTGADVENGLGHGLSTSEDNFTPFRKGKIRKEISERMAKAAKYAIKPVEIKPVAEAKMETTEEPTTTEERVEEPKVEKPKVEDPKAIMAEQKFLNKTLGLSLPVDGIADEKFYTARESYHTNKNNKNKPVVVTKPTVITNEEKPAVITGKGSGDYSHPGNPGKKYTKDGNGKWHILEGNKLVPITDPTRIARLEKDATTYSQAKENINKSKTEKKIETPKSGKEEGIKLPSGSKASIRPDIKKPEKTESIADDVMSGLGKLTDKISTFVGGYETPADKKVIISDEEGKRLDEEFKAQELKGEKDWNAKQAKKLQEELQGQKVEMTAIQKNNKIAADDATTVNARKELAAKKAKETERLKKEIANKEAEQLREIQGRAKTLEMKEEVMKNSKRPRQPSDLEIEGEKFKKLKTSVSKLKLTAAEVKIYNEGSRDQIIALGKKHNIKFENGGRLIPKFQAGNGLTITNPGMPGYQKPIGNGLNIPAPENMDIVGKYGTFGENKFHLLGPEKKNDYPGFVLGEQEKVLKPKRYRDTTNRGNTGMGTADKLSIAGSVLQTALPLAAMGYQVYNAYKNYKNPIVAKNPTRSVEQVFTPQVDAMDLGSSDILNQKNKLIAQAGRYRAMNADPNLQEVGQQTTRSSANALKAQMLSDQGSAFAANKINFRANMNAAQATRADQLNKYISNKNYMAELNAQTENANAAKKAEALSNWRDVQGAAVGNIAKIFGDNLQYNRDVASGLDDVKYQRDYTKLKDSYDTADQEVDRMKFDLKRDPNAYTVEEQKAAIEKLKAAKTSVENLTTAPIQAPTIRSWLSQRRTV
jgi:hypothetical protein